MKSFTISLLTTITLTACTTVPKSNWSDETRSGVLQDCNNQGVSIGLPAEVASTYCDCLVPKIEEGVPVESRRADIVWVKGPAGTAATKQCADEVAKKFKFN